MDIYAMLIRAKQLSMAATARVIWLCACVRYWPGRGLEYVCALLGLATSCSETFLQLLISFSIF